MKLIDRVHSEYVYGRRVRVLSERLAELLPSHATVLDVGCGDGTIAHLLQQRRRDVHLEGIDVLVRQGAMIPVTPFDGLHIPFPEASFDAVMFVDVLHHTEDPMVLLREAVRVARKAVVIKDHTLDGLLATSTLRLMDYVGNARFGVALPYNYWPRARWMQAFAELRVTPAVWHEQLHLYPPPASWVFDRSLHFATRLDRDTA
jgi:SAM-dependent methyltransferase